MKVCADDPSPIICRGSFLTYRLTCEFDRRLNVSTAVGVNVTDKKSFVFDKAAKTNFTAQMKFYTTDLFDTPEAPPIKVIDIEIHLWHFLHMKYLLLGKVKKSYGSGPLIFQNVCAHADSFSFHHFFYHYRKHRFCTEHQGYQKIKAPISKPP